MSAEVFAVVALVLKFYLVLLTRKRKRPVPGVGAAVFAASLLSGILFGICIFVFLDSFTGKLGYSFAMCLVGASFVVAGGFAHYIDKECH